MQTFVLDVSACMPWSCEDEALASEEMLEWARRGGELNFPSIGPARGKVKVVGQFKRRGCAISPRSGRMPRPTNRCRRPKSSLTQTNGAYFPMEAGLQGALDEDY